jgi:hypothetical protein
MKNWIASVVFVVAVVLAFTLAFTWQNSYGRLTAWLIVAVGVVVLSVALSPGSGPSLKYLLIDERNRYSQPALITFCWFVTIVSAYLACAAWNVALWTPGTRPLPVEIQIPPALWVLAGVVGVDIVGTGIILADKRRRMSSPLQQAAANQAGLTLAGTLFVRPSASNAELRDLITHDEITAQDTPDLAALQKLLFQITAVIVYALALGRLIFSTDPALPITGFPSIPEGFLALLGISTATALVNRAVPR